MNLIDKLEDINLRFQEVGKELMDPLVASDVKKFASLNREYTQLKEISDALASYKLLVSNLEEAKKILASEEDPEMLDMAKTELQALEPQLQSTEDALKMMLVPPDPDDDKSAIVEVRAGTGGDEASIFAGDLYRMYQRFAEIKGWTFELVGFNEGSSGGFKEISFSLEGPGVYGFMKYESGVHRVQRVPQTESQGRVHTSAATVAVLPEAEELDVELNMNDVKKDTFRASGAGGQHINKTESAVRLTHLPTGIVVECQDGRSQHKNYDQALTVLRSRLYEMENSKRLAEIAAKRKTMVSTGDRSAKIRTYNYPQGRITDHRIGYTIYNLPAFMNGEIEDVIEALRVAENAEKLKAGEVVGG
ncbi:MAG: peptide chain release factor 1 [Bacteroidetes bacterium]|jgi:peptide chain release factor 1|nr:peptide chain release factor 1 [Bacteroidota bacterium]